MDETTEQATVPSTLPELTPRQRMVMRLASGISHDMQTGTVAEQHTAALLQLVADAVAHGYEQGLTTTGREWRAAWERAGGGSDGQWVSQWQAWNEGPEA